MIAAVFALLAYPALSGAGATALAHAPRDIGSFAERRAECEHWGGEEPYDKSRLTQINAAVAKLRCGRLPADEKALRRKYKGRPRLLRLILVE